MEHIAISGTGKQTLPLFRQLELRQIIDFAKGSEHLDEDVVQKQLRALWTAYCLHHNLDVDTRSYDNDLLSLWSQMEGDSVMKSAWENYGWFDLFMSALLC